MSITTPIDDRVVAQENGNLDEDGGRNEVDVLGIGFGPANLSLAIALEEHNAAQGADGQLRARFVEARSSFGWHDGMLLPGTTMQISFLKDLVALRTPTSSYTFLNFLHERGRLSDFINLKTFFPPRHEFHEYLGWAAGRIGVPVSYGTRATRIEWNGSRFEVQLRPVGAQNGAVETILAKDVVVGTGIRPSLPDGVEPTARVFHNHGLLSALQRVPSRRHGRFVVVGSGQSAAEVAAYLHDAYPDAEVHVTFRRFGYTPSDDTPFANRIFDPESVDDFYSAPSELKQRLLDYHWLTNYSAVDADLIRELYRREYTETQQGRRRLFVHRVTEIEQQIERPDGVEVTLRDLGDRDRVRVEADAVVYATGFRPTDARGLLGASIDASEAFDEELPVVERDYRLRLSQLPGRIFLNGGVQHSHGLTSSLLSNVAIRSADILRAVTEERRVPQQ